MTTIHLQGIGRQPAIPACELQVGDLLSWNYTYRGYKVVAINLDRSPKYLEISEQNVQSGKITTRRLLKDRLVAAYRP